MLSSNCELCGCKKSRFTEEQESSGLLVLRNTSKWKSYFLHGLFFLKDIKSIYQ